MAVARGPVVAAVRAAALPRSSGAVVRQLVLSTALVSMLASCTVLAPIATGTTIATHNAIADDQNAWHYTTPLLVSAGVGLVADILLFYALARAWSHPMT